MRTLLLIPLLALAAGCTLFGPASDDDVGDLSEARARWAARGWSDYDLRIMRGCFCLGAGEFDVWVRDDAVAAVWGVENQSTEVRSDQWAYFPTMDDLLDLVDRALREADEVTVAWDDRGWPSRIDIDWYRDAVDDEISYRIDAVERASEGEVVILAPGDRLLGDGWTVRFDEIAEDSRCPGWVLCVWAGQAVARFTLTVPGEAPTPFELTDIPALRSDVRSRVVGSRRVTLLAVDPYPQNPEEPIPADDYRVRLLVESL